MKNIIVCFLIILTLTSCTSLSNNISNNHTIGVKYIDCPSANVLCNSPKIFNRDLLYLCNQYDYLNQNKDKSGNVTLLSMNSNTEKDINIFAQSIAYSNNSLYYCHSRDINKYNLETKEDSHLLSRNQEGQVSGDVCIYNDILVWWEGTSNEDGAINSIQYYSYDLKNNNKKLLCESNYIFSPFEIMKIRNGYLSYAKKNGNTYDIYAVNIENGSEKILQNGVDREPVRIIYDGNLLMWSSDDSWIYLSRNKKIVKIDQCDCDIDIFNGRYLIYTSNNSIKVYDIFEGSITFEYIIDEDINDDNSISLCRWFDTNQQDGSTAFIYRDSKKSKMLYPDWNNEVEPDLLLLLEFTRINMLE